MNNLAETIYSALMDLGKGQCDCDRPIDPSRYVSLSDVEVWLTKRHIKEVKKTAEKYMPDKVCTECGRHATHIVNDCAPVCDNHAQWAMRDGFLVEKYMPSNDVLEETIKMLGSRELRG